VEEGVEAVIATTTMKNVTWYPFALSVSLTMNDECVICLAHITGDTGIAVLSCRHIFHLSCVYRWFQEGESTCPCCRQEELPVEGEDDEDDNITVISVYSSEGEDDEESIPLYELRLQITVTDEGRSVSTASG
jgi:hypothetical protein